MEYMKFWHSGGARTNTASSLSIRHVFLMISQKVCDVTMELCHLYSLLDKSHQTLRLSLPFLDLRKANFLKKINLSQDRHFSGYLTVEISIRPVSRKALLL